LRKDNAFQLGGAVVGLIVALALMLAGAGNAYANSVSYTGEGTNLEPGQTKGLPVLMGFELRGKGCPTGPHCFDHAVLRKLDGVSWAYPNCPEILDGVFEFDHGIRVARNAPHRFSASGASDVYAGDQVEIEGRFPRHGRIAKGWFTITDQGCSTGRVHWTARPD
jgi:hypothetical protein